MESLPKPSIDTGSGLERVAAILQGVESNYDTDLFQPLLEAAADAASKRYGASEGDDISLRVIADHIRAIGFLLADGVIPKSEGRGYVLRRLLRRAVRHGMRLGFEEPFLSPLLPVLGGVLGSAYPELGRVESASRATVEAEESKFFSTLAAGSRQMQDAIEAAKSSGSSVLPGDAVFRLYDTFGLPVEIIEEIAEEEQMTLDLPGFEQALEEQRQRSRVAGGGSVTGLAGLRAVLGDGELDSRFVGYDQLRLDGIECLRLLRLGEEGAVEQTDRLELGEQGLLITAQTPFYAESGGQVADRGEVTGPNGRAAVTDVQKDPAGLIVHTIEVADGTIVAGDALDLHVDEQLRRSTERHHTATHLLHAALRSTLGEGVRQAGSLVHPERLRFDFTYGGPVAAEDLQTIGGLVNEWVQRAVAVEISEQSYDQALERGAMALFGEKYGDRVRTVEVPGFSLELCGGCHVRNTGAIGPFVVTQERGVASGVRRIEALSGGAAEQHFEHQRALLQGVENALGVSAERAAKEIEQLKTQLKDKERELSALRMKLLSGGASGDDAEETEVAGVRMLVREVPPAPANELRNMADVLRGRLGSGVVVLGARGEGSVSLVAAVTDDLKGRLNAGQLARSMGDAVGGSGGGRPDFAQAGGKDPSRLDEAFRVAREQVGAQLEGGA